MPYDQNETHVVRRSRNFETSSTYPSTIQMCTPRGEPFCVEICMRTSNDPWEHGGYDAEILHTSVRVDHVREYPSSIQIVTAKDRCHTSWNVHVRSRSADNEKLIHKHHTARKFHQPPSDSTIQRDSARVTETAICCWWKCFRNKQKDKSLQPMNSDSKLVFVTQGAADSHTSRPLVSCPKSYCFLHDCADHNLNIITLGQVVMVTSCTIVFTSYHNYHLGPIFVSRWNVSSSSCSTRWRRSSDLLKITCVHIRWRLLVKGGILWCSSGRRWFQRLCFPWNDLVPPPPKGMSTLENWVSPSSVLWMVLSGILSFGIVVHILARLLPRWFGFPWLFFFCFLDFRSCWYDFKTSFAWKGCLDFFLWLEDALKN